MSEQGVGDAGAWLAFSGGAPLQSRTLASEPAGAVAGMRRALAGLDFDALQAAGNREELEALAEVLQKRAIDTAMRSLAGAQRYGLGGTSRRAADWLRYAREMGRFRALARAPLNPGLMAGEMLSKMPKD